MSLPSEKLIEYTQNIHQVLMAAGVEVLGPREADHIFRQVTCEKFDLGGTILPAVYTAIKQHYGEPGAQGVGLRLGRAVLKYGIRLWGQQAGLNKAEFRLQPSPRKVRWILTALGEQLLQNFGAPTRLSENGQYWYLTVESCPACRGRRAESPDCPILTGLLQEVLAWSAGGRYHCVEEVSCCAQGDSACQFRIEKKALD